MSRRAGWGCLVVLFLAMMVSSAMAYMPSPPTAVTPENLVKNPKFKQAPSQGSDSHGRPLKAGAADIQDWTVASGTVYVYDRNDAHWINLASGGIEQTIATRPGTHYEVKIDVTAVRPGPRFKVLEVKMGDQAQTFSKDVEVPLDETTYWATYTAGFKARATRTRMVLSGRMNGDYHGPIVGTVTVVPQDEAVVAARPLLPGYQALEYAVRVKSASAMAEVLTADAQWRLLDGRTLAPRDLPAEVKKMGEQLNLFAKYVVRVNSKTPGRLEAEVVETRTWYVMVGARRQDHVLTVKRVDTWVQTKPGTWKMKLLEQKSATHTVDGKPVEERR